MGANGLTLFSFDLIVRTRDGLTHFQARSGGGILCRGGEWHSSALWRQTLSPSPGQYAPPLSPVYLTPYAARVVNETNSE